MINRQEAPEIVAIKKLNTGFPEQEEGVYRVVSEEGVFKLDIVFPNAGYGLANDKYAAIYAMDLLMSGNGKENAHEIADSIDVLGGFVFKACEYYTSSISIYGLNENLEKLLKIVKYNLDNCVFEENELSVFKSKKISELNINLNKTGFLSSRRINQILFGELHPYALAGNEKEIMGINSQMLLKYRSEKLKDPYFIFTGSESIKIKETLATCGFTPGLIGPDTNTEELPQEQDLNSFVEKSGVTQNAIKMGKILPSRNHPDFFKMSLFNLILGGYFGSRLMKNIREEKGLTYGISSGITPFKNFSLFKISSECNKSLTEEVRSEIIKEIKILQTETVSDEEMTVAKNYLCGALLRSFDGAFNISDRFKGFLELNTNKEYYDQYFKAIQEISPEDIMACANNYFKSETLKYCIAGEL